MHGVHRSGWSHDSRSDILIILMMVANTSRIVNEEMLLYILLLQEGGVSSQLKNGEVLCPVYWIE